MVITVEEYGALSKRKHGMSIPLRLLNRLHIGRPIAARRNALLPHYLAWVHVQPVIDEHKGVLIETAGEFRVETTGDSPVVGYLVHLLEMHESFLDPSGTSIRGRRDTSTIDHFLLALDDEELSLYLSRLLPDYTGLCMPDDAGYPPFNWHAPKLPYFADDLLSMALSIHREPNMLLLRSAFSLGQCVFTERGLESALARLVQYGEVSYIQMLLDWGVSITKQFASESLLRTAAKQNDLKMVSFLLDHGADINQKDCNGTVLCFAAETNDDGLTHLLLNRGADTSLVDYYNRTPLGYAVHNGNLQIMRALLQKGADVNALSQFGRMELSPLTIAADRGYENLATLLRKWGAVEARRPLPGPALI